jgi:putative membrane protein
MDRREQMQERPMIDYVTLLLTNMVSGLIVLACFLWWGRDGPDGRPWAPAFGMCGLVATVGGFAMTLTWPIPRPYSMAYGEMSVLFGVLFLGGAWSLAMGWSLRPLGCYAFVPGLAAILLGVRIIELSLTSMPVMSGAGFIMTGLGGVGAGVTLWRRDCKGLRILGASVMLAAALLWAATGFMAYSAHMVPPGAR